MRCNPRNKLDKTLEQKHISRPKSPRNYRHINNAIDLDSSYTNNFRKNPKSKAPRCTYIRPCCSLSFIKQSHDYTSPPKLFGIGRLQPKEKEKRLQYEVDKQRQGLVDSVRDLKNLGSAKEKAWADKYIYNKSQRQRRYV